MNQHQLARNSQVQAARQRLAMRQGGVPGGAPMGNVAGCGPSFNQGYWPVQPNDPQQGWYPVPVSEVIPNMAPFIPPESIATPYSTVLKQNIAPLSAIVQAGDTGATTIEVSCRGGSLFYASAVSTCNECFQIIINSIEVGGSEYDLICGDGVDAGIWNTDDCYCPFDVGCISTISPATITFSPFGTPSVLPFLNFNFWGERISGFRDCGYQPPWLPPFWAPFPGAPNGYSNGGMRGQSAGGGQIAPPNGGGSAANPGMLQGYGQHPGYLRGW